jgi:hypothetical protein
MAAIAGGCHFATVIMGVLLEKSTNDSKCTQILLFVMAVVVIFSPVVAGGLRAMCLLGECGQESETAVLTLCRAVIVVK